MSEQTNPLDPKLLRNALGNFATGITVITAQSTSGEKVGVTANSFNSLSMDPPLILWSLDKRAGSYAVFSSADYFAVNVLSSDQMATSNHFATRQQDKFAGIEIEIGAGGAPLLLGCAARFQCRVYQKIDAGDHWLFIGQVEQFDSQGKAPLCYHQGGYSMVSPHPGSYQPSEAAQVSPHSDKLNNNTLYLMLMAAQSYQQGYTPQQEALGLNTIAARIVMNLSENDTLSTTSLARTVFAPEVDITASATLLEVEGYVTRSQENGFSLTTKGETQAQQYWSLVERYQDNILQQHTNEEIDIFKQILKTIANA